MESSLEQDVNTINENNHPKSLLDNLKEEEGNPILTAGSLDMRGVEHPLYNMMCVLIRVKGAVDWNNGLPLRQTSGDEFKLERHHIFPKSILGKHGWNTNGNHYARKRVHEIANRIPLTREGNMSIFNKSPKEYLPIVEEKYPGALEKSLIPQDRRLWEVENYEDFLRERRTLIAKEINKFMEQLLD